MENAQKKGSRVGILDELRGFAIICMVVYHAMYDLKYIFGLDVPVFFDGWFDVIRDIFAGLFLFISGTVCIAKIYDILSIFRQRKRRLMFILFPRIRPVQVLHT